MRIDDVVAKLVEQTQADDQAKLQQVKDTLRLPEKREAAQRYADAIARRATEISGILRETDISPRHRAQIVKDRPGLEPYFTALDDKRADLERVSFAQQSKLQRAIVRYDKLSLEDLVPRVPFEYWEQTAFGPLSPTIWKLYEALGNAIPLADVDVAIERVRTAHAVLTERLSAVASSRQAG